MAGEGRRALQGAVNSLLSRKLDKPNLVSGMCGTYLNGRKTLKVSNRQDFIWVRLRGATSEVIQAFNDSVTAHWDLPILVYRDPLFPDIWKVYGRDLTRYTDWGGTSYLRQHADAHMFAGGRTGADVVWVFKRQFMPLLTRPNATATMSVFVESDYYYWDGRYRWWPGSGTVDLSSYKPTGAFNAKYLTLILDGTAGLLEVLEGAEFNAIYPPDDPTAFIPAPAADDGIPLVGIKLLTGTSSLGWGELFDLRNIVSPLGITGTDHGILSGLLDDDHPQYLLLAGRGGQIVYDDVTISGSLIVPYEMIVGAGDGTSSPIGSTIRGPDAVGDSLPGADVTFDAGRGTGPAASGRFSFRTGPAGSAPPPNFGSVTTAVQNSGQTLIISHEVSGNNPLLVVALSHRASTALSAHYNDQPLTFIRSDLNGDRRTELWYLQAPPTGTHSVVVTGTADMSSMIGAAVTITDAAQVSPIAADAGGTGGTGTFPNTSISSNTSQLILDVVAWYPAGGGNVITVDPSQDERWHTASPDLNIGGAGSTEDGEDGSTSMDWTLSDGRFDWAQSVIAIDPAADTPTTLTERLIVESDYVAVSGTFLAASDIAGFAGDVHVTGSVYSGDGSFHTRGWLQTRDRATPSTPPASEGRWYQQSGTAYFINSAGEISQLSHLGGGAPITDHGALTGLGDDDHSQYLLLPGRGGQIIYDNITVSGTMTIFTDPSALGLYVRAGEIRFFRDTSNNTPLLLNFYRTRAGGTALQAGDIIQDWRWTFFNSTPAATTGAQWRTFVIQPTAGAEYVGQDLSIVVNGTLRTMISINAVNGVIINENAQSLDFRVEGVSDPFLIFADASTDRVGIGTSSPSFKFQVDGDIASVPSSGDANVRILRPNDINTDAFVLYDQQVVGGKLWQHGLLAADANGDFHLQSFDGSSTATRIRVSRTTGDAFFRADITATGSITADSGVIENDLDVKGIPTSWLPFTLFDSTPPFVTGTHGVFVSSAGLASILDGWRQTYWVSTTNNAANHWMIHLYKYDGVSRTLLSALDTKAGGAWTWAVASTTDIHSIAAAIDLIYIEAVSTGTPGLLYLAAPHIKMRPG